MAEGPARLDPGTRKELLQVLDFGRVDAESETDLDRRFVRTSDFERFIRPDIQLVLGAKGTGKSAIFDLFARFEQTARSQAGREIEDVIVATGTGLGDLHEVATGDLEELRPDNDYGRLWRLYIAVKAAFAVADLARGTNGAVAQVLKAAGEIPDRRIGPLLGRLWRAVVSAEAPGEIGVAGVSIGDFDHGTLDVTQILNDANGLLERRGRRAWILFDKVDELHPGRPAERKRALEGLVAEAMSVRRTFPRIEPRIFLRTDIWKDLDFTNKTHLVDRQVELSWSPLQLARILVKGAMTHADVAAYVTARVPEARTGADTLNDDSLLPALTTLLPDKAYPGEREADILDWIYARVTDARGTAFPRETILLGNRARQRQLTLGETGDVSSSLIGREAIRDAFSEVSTLRCDTYLAEFPWLREHFARFAGRTQAEFTRDEVTAMMEGLEPTGTEMLTALYDVGLLRPVGGHVSTADVFEVPRLYRQGLGLVIRGRA